MLDEETAKELKGAGILALITIGVFLVFILFVWPQTDMMKAKYSQDRTDAINYLSNSFLYNPYLTETQRNDIMRKYNITDKDLSNPPSLEGFVK